MSTYENLDLLSAREIIHADEAGLGLSQSPIPSLRRNSIKFLSSIPAADLPGVLTQLHQLFVCHAVDIGVFGILGIIL